MIIGCRADGRYYSKYFRRSMASGASANRVTCNIGRDAAPSHPPLMVIGRSTHPPFSRHAQNRFPRQGQRFLSPGLLIPSIGLKIPFAKYQNPTKRPSPVTLHAHLKLSSKTGQSGTRSTNTKRRFRFQWMQLLVNDL